MGNAASKEECDEMSAQVDAEVEALKADFLPAQIEEYRSWKSTSDSENAPVKAFTAPDPQNTSRTQSLDPHPRLVRSSKGDATSPSIPKQSALEEDLLSRWNPRKEPPQKALPSEEGVSKESEDESSRLCNVTGSTSVPPKPKKGRELLETQTMGLNSQSSRSSSVSSVPREGPTPETVVVSTSISGKRAVLSAGLDDERQSTSLKAVKSSNEPSPPSLSISTSQSGLGRIPKRTSTVVSHQATDSDVEQPTARIDERPPGWYKSLKRSKDRGKDESNADILIRGLKDSITKCKSEKDGAIGTTLFAQLRHKIHRVAFERVTDQLLRNNLMLHNADGLPQLFEKEYSGGVAWPFDVKADAEELYNKWCRRVFETDLLRGIIPGKPAERKKDRSKSGTGSSSSSDKIDPLYSGKVSANYHGNGLLLNGQWWPTQLTVVRDGGHGATIAGIHGSDGTGAYSCIMSGGHDYEDEDHGELVLYCGTDSDNGNVTEGTKRLLESCEGREPVRLIRSSKLKSEWAPELGFRYDGLYNVVSYTLLDPVDSQRQRHRFRLERQTGQDPIRGSGPERRPTTEEVETYRNDKRLRGYT